MGRLMGACVNICFYILGLGTKPSQLVCEPQLRHRAEGGLARDGNVSLGTPR